ncbi:putative nuclear RNA export factor SDE5 isoform X1 [Coffea arabica]|uniref:Nuclear RNA export factor SDE5 isoform X1 n=1 Tax=Coffea arabica TaxID=13443 RepID=A0ABM4UDD6_COFAR
MEPEELPSTLSYYDNDKRNLEQLLETFGSVVSLDDIASAYCQSGRNLYAARNILCNLQCCTSKSSIFMSEEELQSANASSVCPSDNSVEMAQDSKSKPRKSPACMGIVSSVIGKQYVMPKTSTNGSCKPKPLILNSDDIPVSELWDEKDFLNSTERSGTMSHGIEEFLFKMLGEGFSLNKSVIQDIVGQCGYDVTKSMDKLLDLSASTLGKSDDVLKASSEKPKQGYRNMVSLLPEDQIPCTSFESLKYTPDTGNVEHQADRRNRHDLEKEVLGTLFTVRPRPEPEPKKYHPMKEVRRSSLHHFIVEEPLKETVIEDEPVIRTKQVSENNNEENEDDYDVLRKAVMEYWTTMKEYYKAAADAFAINDHEKAHKLMEEGHFFMKKAREADEKSAEKLIESNDEEEMFVDLNEFEPKDALRFLKIQLTSLSGIASYKYLKVLVGSNEQNAKSGPRKRLITKLLERESIKWSEEGNGWVIVIQLDVIDPKKLSFGRK